jgi:transcriptional regulator with XRE-family HTH domain
MLSCIALDDTHVHHRRKPADENAGLHKYRTSPVDPRGIIEDLRVKRGYTSLRALAMAAEVPQPTLQRYMTRKTDSMEVSSFMALAHTLGVTLSELLGEVPLSQGGMLRELHHAACDLTDSQLQQLVQIARVLQPKL